MAFKKKVILRADGDKEIGMGHFFRLIALADILNDDFYCVYVTRDPSAYQKDLIYRVCDELIELPNASSHFERFLDILKGNEIVVLDNYFFCTKEQQKIKEKGCKLVCIDDLHDKHYVSDVIINHAEGVKPENFSVESYSHLYLGLQYAILRKPFYKKHKNKKKDFDYLINMGGVDPYNLTYKLSELIFEVSPTSKIAVLSSMMNNSKETCKNNKNLTTFTNLSATDIVGLMQRSCFGILPSSTISLEAIATRLPFATGFFVDNQKYIYSGLIKNEIALPLGDLKNLDENHFKNLIENDFFNKNHLLESITLNQEKYLDKKSPNRLKNIFRNL